MKIWWDRGFTLEEDEAIRQVVRQWEQRTGYRVQLSFYNNDELSKKTQRALQAGTPPDVLMTDNADRVLNPTLAWEGKLVDVSDVIESVKPFYPKIVLQSAYFYNNQKKQRSYYAVPIHQSIPHVFYWRDLLEQIGKTEKDIPQDWDGFWEFWKQTQNTLRSQSYPKIYGIGAPMSSRAGDTYEVFEQILEAYDVELVDSKGQLRLNDPKVRQAVINCIDWYTKFYQQGYVPPEAVNWLNPDNNRSLLNRHVVMTLNNSLSIPAAVRQDADLYKNKLGTIGYPNKPNGKPMRYVALIRQATIIAGSTNQRLAKDFLKYFVQPEIIGSYLKSAGGRFLPVHNLVWEDPFWTNPSDRHISAAAKPLIAGQTRLLYTAQNPAYNIVLMKNIWGQAIQQVTQERISPEQAANKAIQQIEEIFNKWR
ncbi:MAG: ABC transporter substrate-binding protein [Scytonema sp. PMC 1069.18]|nr:ABC transporter substrate-binding protein [Scytonema sp. PMC 1069.18]